MTEDEVPYRIPPYHIVSPAAQNICSRSGLHSAMHTLRWRLWMDIHALGCDYDRFRPSVHNCNLCVCAKVTHNFTDTMHDVVSLIRLRLI